MSSFNDLPSSKPVRGEQNGAGFFSSLGKVLQSAPILSTAASLLPGGKIAAPLLASQGLGRRQRKPRKKKAQAGGKINFKKLGKAALPLLKQSGLVSKNAKRIPVAGQLIESLAKSQGYGRKPRRKRAPKKQLL